MNFFRHGIFRWLLIGAVLYWPLAYVQADITRVGLDGVAVMLAIALAIMLGTDILPIFANGGKDRRAQGYLGIFLICLGFSLLRTWGIMSRLSSFPNWMLYSPISGFFIYLQAAGLGCLFFSFDTIEEPEQRLSTKWLIIIVGALGLLIGLVLGHFPFDDLN